MDLGRPNHDIGRNMANGQLLFLALGCWHCSCTLLGSSSDSLFSCFSVPSRTILFSSSAQPQYGASVNKTKYFCITTCMEVSISLSCLFVHEPLYQNYSTVLQIPFLPWFLVHGPPHHFPRMCGACSGLPRSGYYMKVGYSSSLLLLWTLANTCIILCFIKLASNHP